jgi:hypothetical protein
MDDAAWGALALALTVLGGIYTWLAYQRRGVTAAVRGAGLTLVPVAAWLTGVLELLTEVGGAVGDWALDLAFSPTMWVGTALGALAVVLLVVSGFLGRRQVGTTKREPEASKASEAEELPAAQQRGASAIDDEMAEIEAILRNRGIT